MTTPGKIVIARREALDWTQTELSRRSGVKLNTLRDIEKKGGEMSSMLPKLAEALGLDAIALSKGRLLERINRQAVLNEDIEHLGTAKSSELLPVAGAAQLGTNGFYDQVNSVGADGYVIARSNDPEAYVLRVHGSSMHPAIRDRWFVVVEPNSPLSPLEYVAIELTDGKKMVKEFLSKNKDSVTVQSVNGGERIVLDTKEIKHIHAVGDLVPPSKHRNV